MNLYVVVMGTEKGMPVEMPVVPRVGDRLLLGAFGNLVVGAVTWTPEVDGQDALVGLTPLPNDVTRPLHG